jgi:hypothetical protein
MKKILMVTGLLMGLLAFSTVQAQSDVDAIVNAFKSANAAQVGQYFDDMLDIKLMEKPEIKSISRNQATLALKAFFSENGVKGFEKTSERELGNTMYLTGKLQGDDKGHNLTILLKQKDGKRMIISLRIS